jgi:SAM-dependent methyltransferase
VNDLTPIEQRWRAIAPPEAVDSARALYELMPRERSGNLPFVDVPYDATRAQHWADAARVADYAAALPRGGTRVLDIGPGDGWPALPLAAALPQTQVLGVDPAPLRTRTCAANGARLGITNATFVTADAEVLPFADASFDLVTAAQALEEASEPHRVFAELARVLRSGGVLRASYQVWHLPVPEFETVTLVGGVDCLLYTYARRTQEPPRERRYVLVLPSDGPVAEVHGDALIASAEAPRAYGETLVEASSPLGVPLLDRLAPYARRSMVVELHRWTTAWVLEALRGAGFREAHGTTHPGDLARGIVRALDARGQLDALAPHFDSLTRAIGEAAGHMEGDAMVLAVR